MCRSSTYHHELVTENTITKLQKLNSLPRNLRQAINLPCYFWKNIFVRSIYSSPEKYSLKGLHGCWRLSQTYFWKKFKQHNKRVIAKFVNRKCSEAMCQRKKEIVKSNVFVSHSLCPYLWRSSASAEES